MRQVRKCVFETNSSSTHSVVVKRGKGLQPNYLFISDDGYIHSEFGEFGWEVWNYDDQETRLCYLLTMARILEHCNEESFGGGEEDFRIDMDRFMETRSFREIEDVVVEYTGCRGIRCDRSDYYADHQSREDYGTIHDFLNEYGIDIKEFIFGAGVTLHTDNDNH